MLDKSLIDTLKRVDPDRYRTAMLAPKDERGQLLVLYAFHAELAKVPEIVSETMIGNIRYQWWRDAIEEIYSGQEPRKHEVVLPLTTLIQEKGLSRFHMDQLIDGRERDLDPAPFADLNAAKDYCSHTSGVLAQLAARIMNSEDVNRAKDLGTLWGLTGLARSWRYYTNGMLTHLNFTDVLDLIHSNYEAVRAEGKLPSNLVPAIGYAALIPGFTKPMKAAGYDPKTQTPDYSQLRKKLRVLRTALSGKI